MLFFATFAHLLFVIKNKVSYLDLKKAVMSVSREKSSLSKFKQRTKKIDSKKIFFLSLSMTIWRLLLQNVLKNGNGKLERESLLQLAAGCSERKPVFETSFCSWRPLFYRIRHITPFCAIIRIETGFQNWFYIKVANDDTSPKI